MEIRQTLEALKQQEQQQVIQMERAMQGLSAFLTRRSETLVALLEQVETQKQTQETLSRDMDRVRASEERRRAELQDMFQQLDQKIEAMRETLAAQQQLSAENERCRRQITEQEHEIKALRDELTAQRERAEDGADALQEMQTLYRSYRDFRTWCQGQEGRGQRKAILPLASDNFIAYLASCLSENALGQIFAYAEHVVWDPGKTEERTMLDQMIESCITAQFLANRRRLQRQEIRPGAKFDYALYCKQAETPAVCRITRVLLRGVEQYDGTLLKGCKAFVEVE